MGDSATAKPKRPDGLHAGDRQRRAQQDANGSIGAHHDGVGMEPAVAAGDAARQVGREVGRECDDQRDHQHPVAVEVPADDQRAEDQRSEDDQAGQCEAERSHPFDNWTSALAERPSVRQRAGQLLLEGQEEPGRERERGDPQAGDRLDGLVAAERDTCHLQEEVAADAGDQQTDAYRNGAFRQGNSSDTLGVTG